MNEYEFINKRRRYLERLKEERFEGHKCNGCVWGRWTGINFVCMLPNCLKELGNFRRD